MLTIIAGYIICKQSYLIGHWFPKHSSAGKESACNTGDPASIPGSERSSGEGIGCPVQYSWASLVAQLVKKPPVMRETWVQSLGQKIPWRRERLPTPVFWPGEFHGLYSPWGHKEQTRLSDLHLHFINGVEVTNCPRLRLIL